MNVIILALENVPVAGTKQGGEPKPLTTVARFVILTLPPWGGVGETDANY